ncbi:MAG TPA: cupin domain-containing protein [Allosphingosinicella sp.]|uniref:cupin domain-containing protein n=1 Tax=Allosphingosinicella sp. TaxID=2823234 RepID=UPI002ED98069
MPKLDLDQIEQTNRTTYPEPFASDMGGRWFRRVGDFAGLQDFGASHVVLKPGGISSQRHWHVDEDELVVMLEGEAVLVEDQGRTIMRPGDVAVFPKNTGDGHHLINESDSDCIFLAVGKKAVGVAYYPDIDLVWNGPSGRYEHKDGSPY